VIEGPLILRAVLALLLYAFLGVALATLWRGLHTQDRDQNTTPPPACLITEGDQPARTIALYPITALGRAEDNHVVLDDPYASSHHAMVIWRDQRWWLEDLQSHNGTLLNGEPVTEPALLTTGDRLQLGQSRMRFEADSRQRIASDADGTPIIPTTQA